MKNLKSFLQSCNKSLINQACSGPYWENIGPRSFLYGPRYARSVLSRPRADILPVRPSRLVNKIYVINSSTLDRRNWSLSTVTSIRWSKELLIPSTRVRSCKWKQIVWAKLFMPETWNVAVHEKMYDGCAVRPMKASVAAKHASKMLGLLWNLGVFFTAKITEILSRIVIGQVISDMTVRMINPISSVRCNCRVILHIWSYLKIDWIYFGYVCHDYSWDQAPVSRKSRNFSGAFRVT